MLGDLFHLLTDPQALIAAFGSLAYVGLFAVIFAETGLFVGFFLPGDSLLLVAGILATPDQGARLDLPLVVLVCTTAAIVGNMTGFAFGRRVGRRLYEREDSRFFKREHLLAAEKFYEKHGGKTIVLARFMPFVRTFAPIVAGASAMPASRFLAYTVVGGLLWGAGLPIGGYVVGEQFPDIDRYLLVVVVVTITISLAPSVIHIWRRRRTGIQDAIVEDALVGPLGPEIMDNEP
ncbi:MAG: VTT domain-containing protein [Candidatus Limnocylindrales bacterium]